MHIAFPRRAACYALRTVCPFVEAASRIPMLDAPRRADPAVRGLFKFYATFNLWSIFFSWRRSLVEKRNPPPRGRLGWTRRKSGKRRKNNVTRDGSSRPKMKLQFFTTRLPASTIILPSLGLILSPTEYSKGCSQKIAIIVRAFEVSRRRNELLDDGQRRISVCWEN